MKGQPLHVELQESIDPAVFQRGLENVRGMLSLTLGFEPGQTALVVHDDQSTLSRVLAEIYHEACPEARRVRFDADDPAALHAAFDTLVAGDLVVLVQSSRFLMDAFRIRVELFRRGLRVVEHPHLARMTGKAAGLYLESLAYDPRRLRPLGAALREAVAEASTGLVVSRGGGELRCRGGFEPASLNVGDYSGMKNAGGQFPIGEVFTEAVDLASVEGRFSLFAYGDRSFTVAVPPRPIVLHVHGGRVVRAEDSTEEFDAILEGIRADEGVVWLREWGFGLNKAFGPDRVIPDVGTFERMNGLHFSLGAKHQVYPKPGFPRKGGKHHVDVFVDLDSLRLGDRVVFARGDWTVGASASEPSAAS